MRCWHVELDTAVSAYNRCALQTPGTAAKQLVSLAALQRGLRSAYQHAFVRHGLVAKGHELQQHGAADDFLRRTFIDPRSWKMEKRLERYAYRALTLRWWHVELDTAVAEYDRCALQTTGNAAKQLVSLVALQHWLQSA